MKEMHIWEQRVNLFGLTRRCGGAILCCSFVFKMGRWLSKREQFGQFARLINEKVS